MEWKCFINYATITAEDTDYSMRRLMKHLRCLYPWHVLQTIRPSPPHDIHLRSQQHNTLYHHHHLIIIRIPRTIFIVLSIRRQPYKRVHFGSSEQKSVSARWPKTRRLGFKLDLLSLSVGCYRPNIRPSTFVLVLIYRPSEGGRLSLT